MNRTAVLTLPLALVALCACQSTTTTTADAKSSSTATVATSGAASSKSASAAATTAKAAGIGDTITVSGFSGEKVAVTLKAVMDTTSGNQFESAPAGSRYVGLQVAYMNAGSKPYDAAPFVEISGTDAAGQTYKAALVTQLAAGPLFATAAVAVGETSSGWLALEVPTGTKLSKVKVVLDAGLGSNTGVFTIA